MRARNSLLLALVAFSLLAVYCRSVPRHWSAHYFIGFPEGIVLYLGFLLATSPLVNSALVERHHLRRPLSLVLFIVNSGLIYGLSRYLCQGLPYGEDSFEMMMILGILWLYELLSPFREGPCQRMLYPDLGQFVGALGQTRVIIYPAVILIFLLCLSLAVSVAGSYWRNWMGVPIIGYFDRNRVFLMYTLLMSLQCACLPWKQARWLSVLLLSLFLGTVCFGFLLQYAKE